MRNTTYFLSFQDIVIYLCLKTLVGFLKLVELFSP